MQAVLEQPGIVAGTWKAAWRHDASIMDADALLALRQLDSPWGDHFSAERAHVWALLVERVDVELGELNI